MGIRIRLLSFCSGGGGLVIIIGFLLLVLLDRNQIVQSQTRNEPVNCNYIIALPWDVANTLRAPFGGPVSLVLTAITACALLFGLLLSPVSYIFGYPQRIYHPARKPGIFGRSFPPTSSNDSNYNHHYPYNNDGESFDVADAIVHLFHEMSSRIVFDKGDSCTFEENSFSGRELVIMEEEYKAPGFLESIFLLVPEDDEVCRQLMVCHAHGFLGFFPPSVMKLYQWISKHFVEIPEDYKSAIILGLEDQGACAKVYSHCSKDLFQLVRGSFGLIRQKIVRFLPQGTKDIWETFYSRSWEQDRDGRSKKQKR
ncbi:unnamed protein product [Orchesella dallaii]|uniref:Uncharacterized protein n=1 Tax=Orchesella dallaii TaxID=48710 RepID=A0ABP1R882_9HEXA